MAIIGTFNGASIIALPARPGLRQLQVDMNDTVAVTRSPFNGATQVQAWPGADFWTGEITLPQMPVGTAATWSAFFGQLRGMLNVFPLGHPLFRHPQGSALGVPVVSGVNVAMSTFLGTRGWKANQFRALVAGDRLQIGATPANASLPGLCRYHVALNDVNTDGNGNATIEVYPSLRETTIDGETLILNDPKGLFRLAENRRALLSTETRLTGMSFKIMEAR